MWTLVAVSTNSVAQTEAADFSRIGFGAFLTSVASDYQCVGINPANLGFVPTDDVFRLSTPLEFGATRIKRHWSFTAAEGGMSLHSDALSRSGLMDMITQTSSGTFTREDKIAAATAFANKGVRFSIDAMLVGAAYQSGQWGGIALTVRERLAGTFRFNKDAARLAFEGRHFEYFDSLAVNFNGDTVGYSTQPQRFSELFNGTRLAMIWYREYGASYGLQLYHDADLQLYGGASMRYLQGYALIDAEVQTGNLHAMSAISPFFGISYGKATSSSYIPGTDFVPVGDGWSMDLGVTVAYNNTSLGLAVVDVGSIVWDGNVYAAKDTILNGMSSTGFSSYNIFQEAPKITGEGNYFKWEGASEAVSTLPTRIRVGLSHLYSTHWRFGIDAIFPLNTVSGSLGEPIVSLGADWRPLVWLRLGSGIGSGGNMGTFIPISAMFSLFGGMWEMGIASRDVITLFTVNRPVLSLVMGVARIRL